MSSNNLDTETSIIPIPITTTNCESNNAASSSENSKIHGDSKLKPAVKNSLGTKIQHSVEQIPASTRPDLSILKFLGDQKMDFDFGVKKLITQKYATVLGQPNFHILRPKDPSQPINFKNLDPSSLDAPTIQNALEALKIPSPERSVSPDAVYFPPVKMARKTSSPSGVMLKQRPAVPAAKPRPVVVESKKRPQAKILEIPPPKKIKIQKPASSEHSSSEPPSTSSKPRQEKAGTPSIDDAAVRRSNRKVIKPSYLADPSEKQQPTNTHDNSSSSDTDRDYYECAAVIPEFIDGKDISDEKDLEELTIVSKNMEAIDECQLRKYVMACQAKVKCDEHVAFLHLANNDYSLEKALETFDLHDSLPRTSTFNGKNAPGIWNDEDLKTFVRLMNNNKCYKRMHKISKHLSNKSTANVVNAYYALKKDVCSFGREFTICHEIIKTQKLNLGFEYVDSQKCENCINKLWEKPIEEQQPDASLCSLCKLYKELYGKIRPNAEASPQIFNDFSLSHDACLYEMIKENTSTEVFIPDWNVLKQNVYAIKSTMITDFIEATKDLVCDEPTSSVLSEPEKLNENYTYIFTSEKPLTNFTQFYPKNDVSIAECLEMTESPVVAVAEPSNTPSPATKASDDDENEGPPVLINEMEVLKVKEKEVVEKLYDVFYLGYLDDNNEFHNEVGAEFCHTYSKKIQNYDGDIYLNESNKDKVPFEISTENDEADKELLKQYGNVTFCAFCQALVDSKKKFQVAAEALNVPLDFLEAYVRQNYHELKLYFAQFEKMIKTRARRAKGRNRVDDRDKRPLYILNDGLPKKKHNYFLAV